jgi:membrane protein implicated in regulation of membrane protease activity
MELFGFEKDTLLDLTVNVIPLGIILFFIGAFAVVPAFGVDPVFTGLQFALMISMFFLLAVLTYYAGRAIEGAEQAGGDIETTEDHADEAADIDETADHDDSTDETADDEATDA